MPWKNEKEEQHGMDDKPTTEWDSQLEALIVAKAKSGIGRFDQLPVEYEKTPNHAHAHVPGGEGKSLQPLELSTGQCAGRKQYVLSAA